MGTLKEACMELVEVRPGLSRSWRRFHFLGDCMPYHVGERSPEETADMIRRYKLITIHARISRVYFDRAQSYPQERVRDELLEEW